MKLFKISILLIFLIFFAIKIPSFAQEAPAFSTPASQSDPNISYASGKVLKIISEKQNKELAETFNTDQIVQTVKIRILNGEYSGKTIEIQNQLTSSPVYDINLKSGQRVLLNIEKTPDKTRFYVTDVERYPILMIIVGIFLALLLLVGGKKGINTIVSLFITAFLVFFVLVPAILNNYPPIQSAVGVALISTLLTMAIIGGINMKSLAASLGTIFSILAAGFIALLVIHYAPLTGFQDQESVMLWQARPDLDFQGILAASVIIGALGIVMNVGMSIAGSVFEFKKINSDLKPVDLIKSGMNVGKDMMGTMANTLILAYIGGAFSFVLLSANAPLIKLINLNSIATEITAAIAGSIGIVLCVPITAVISGYLAGYAKGGFPKIS